jgi:hypothetical protein
MTQPDLLAWTPPPMDRHGETYTHAEHFERLNSQQADVWAVFKDGQWHTLSSLEKATGHPQASISARLRDFRALLKEKGRTVEREYVERGLFRYRVK